MRGVLIVVRKLYANLQNIVQQRISEVAGNKGVNMKCSVKDYKGNNCPENANHNFIRNNELVSLCDKCFVNYRNGAYGDSFTSDNGDYTKCPDSPSGEHSYQDQPVCVHCGHFA